ncbi:enoyl-CoA hydratase-related protein [Shewanella sp.]|uniref:enoyl-CoA hydratase-related protein n=1 Tax=Shewanella sp. TaxID=50422 RepID=UPI003A97D68F
MPSVLFESDHRGVCRLTLNRPDSANAFDEQLIAELTDALQHLATWQDCRALILQGNGKHFSAGADLNWMQRQAQMDFAANVSDANTLALLMRTLDEFPHPTIALVHGAAFGGALGLLCCCDIAIAHHSARFCLSEVKLGLIPAVISPYVARTIGMRQMRRYALTAEVINAHEALSLGLVHQLADELQPTCEQLVNALLKGAPQAQKYCKQLLGQIAQQPIDTELHQLTAQAIAEVRAKAEAQEGIHAFFDQRSPQWRSQNTEGNHG